RLLHCWVAEVPAVARRTAGRFESLAGLAHQRLGRGLVRDDDTQVAVQAPVGVAVAELGHTTDDALRRYTARSDTLETRFAHRTKGSSWPSTCRPSPTGGHVTSSPQTCRSGHRCSIGSTTWSSRTGTR